MKKYVLEALGCFILGFVLFSTIISQDTNPYFIVSVALFLIVFLLTLLLKNKTMCFFNPAVALGFAVEKKISVKEFWAYFISECIGFALASLFFFVISFFSSGLSESNARLCNVYGESFGVGSSIIFVALLELFVTGILVFVYLYFYNSRMKHTKRSFIVACACALSFMITTPVTLGSVNIAKTIATSIFFGFANYGFSILIISIVLILCGFIGALLGRAIFCMIKKHDSRVR